MRTCRLTDTPSPFIHSFGSAADRSRPPHYSPYVSSPGRRPPASQLASAPRRGGAAVPDGAALRGLLRRRRHAAQVWQLRQLHDRSSGRHVSASAHAWPPRTLISSRAGRAAGRARVFRGGGLSSVRWRGAGLCRGGPTGLSLLLQRVGRIDLLKHSERTPSCPTVPLGGGATAKSCGVTLDSCRPSPTAPTPGADVAVPSASAFAPGGSAR